MIKRSEILGVVVAWLCAASLPPGAQAEPGNPGFVLKNIVYEAGYDRENRAGSAGALPRKLRSRVARIGATAEMGAWRFDLGAGPRRMTGIAGGLDVDAWGHRFDGAAARWIAPGLLAGVAFAYQWDEGTLSDDFVSLPANLTAYQAIPFIAGGLPYGDTLVKADVRLNLQWARLEIDNGGTDRFKTRDVEAGAHLERPLGSGVTAGLGLVGRFTFLEEVALAAEARAKWSAQVVGGFGFQLSDQFELRLDGAWRVFDPVVDEGRLFLSLRQTF